MRTAPFRIIPKPATKDVARTGSVTPNAETADAPNMSIDEYLEKLMKMIPAEVVGLYLVGSGVVPEEEHAILLSWTVFCFAAVIVVRAIGTRDPMGGPPQWGAVLISSVSFVIWIYSVGGSFRWYLGQHYEPYVGSLLVLAWTFLVPMVYSPKATLPA